MQSPLRPNGEGKKINNSLNLNIFKIISMENSSTVTEWQELFFPYKSLWFSMAVAIATFDI